VGNGNSINPGLSKCAITVSTNTAFCLSSLDVGWRTKFQAFVWFSRAARESRSWNLKLKGPLVNQNEMLW
jgi:hypothetical protein